MKVETQITARWLAEQGACDHALARFKRKYGRKRPKPSAVLAACYKIQKFSWFRFLTIKLIGESFWWIANYLKTDGQRFADDHDFEYQAICGLVIGYLESLGC